MGLLRKVTREVGRAGGRVGREVGRTAHHVEHDIRHGVHSVGHTIKRDILPLVVGTAGRKRVHTSHTVAEFQQDVIQLVVTGDEVVIQPVPSPCAGGNHANIVQCTVMLEIEINGGGFVFNDKYCTACGTHFPIIV